MKSNCKVFFITRFNFTKDTATSNKFNLLNSHNNMTSDTKLNETIKRNVSLYLTISSSISAKPISYGSIKFLLHFVETWVENRKKLNNKCNKWNSTVTWVLFFSETGHVTRSNSNSWKISLAKLLLAFFSCFLQFYSTFFFSLNLVPLNQ